jgi:hypothetical protein
MRAPLALLLVLLGLIGGVLVVRAALRPAQGETVAPDGGARADAAADGPGAAHPVETGSEAGPVRQAGVDPGASEGRTEESRGGPAPAIPLGDAPATPRDRREELTLEWIQKRSLRYANELSLAAGAERRIAEILLEADRRMEEVRREARALGGTDLERVRAAAAGVRAWRDAAFEQEFGAELGGRIVELEQAPVRLGEGAEAPASPQDEAGESPPD